MCCVMVTYHAQALAFNGDSIVSLLVYEWAHCTFKVCFLLHCCLRRSLEACTGVAGSGGAKLQQLELSHCKGLTRFHVALIATALPKLQKLTLASCHGIKGDERLLY
jgi:hypothetical protein